MVQIMTKKENNSAEENLKVELYILSEKLKTQEDEFNYAEDDDIIDALIYEQKALQSRFACLMKRARELKLEVDIFDRFAINAEME